MTQSFDPPPSDLQVLRIDRGRKSRRPRSGWKWLLAAGLVLAGLAAGWFALSGRNSGFLPGGGAKPVRVAAVTRAGSGGPAAVLSAGGYVIARHQVEVASKITGRVVSIGVDEGDRVTREQVLARLDDAEVQALVGESEAAVAVARARLAELEAGSRPQEIERARAAMDGARADMENAELNAARARQLVDGKILEQQALDDARTRLEIASKTYEATRQDYSLALIGPRREEIDQARAQLRQAEATLVFNRAQLQNTVIVAPVSGTILNRYVDPGEMVTTGFTSERGARQALVNIADLSDLQVELDIAEADIGKIVLGMPAVITLDAYPGQRYPGSVEFIAAVGDRQKATVKVKTKVLQPDRLMRPEMGAKVIFYPAATPAPRTETMLRVPRAAVVSRQGRNVVFLARGDKAQTQPVSVGMETDGYIAILDGLNGGETVIVSGLETLRDGDRIRIEP